MGRQCEGNYAMCQCKKQNKAENNYNETMKNVLSVSGFHFGLKTSLDMCVFMKYLPVVHTGDKPFSVRERVAFYTFIHVFQ